MELRFLEGNWPHGKFKLQFRKKTDCKDIVGAWIDVPCVNDEKGWVCEKCGSTWDCWNYCAKCGAERL